MGQCPVRQTPEEAYLAEQERLLSELADLLATKEAEFAAANTELERFRDRYARRFAPLYAELDRLEAEVAKLDADRLKTAAARSVAAEAIGRAAASAEILGANDSAPDQRDDLEGQRPDIPPGLRDLYREAAKLIHPDLAADEDERRRRTSLMKGLNSAYAAGDPIAIQRIVDEEGARPEAVLGDDVAARLVRTIRKIAQVRSRTEEIGRLTYAMERDPLYVLCAQCTQASNLTPDPLAEDEARLRSRIEATKRRLRDGASPKHTALEATHA